MIKKIKRIIEGRKKIFKYKLYRLYKMIMKIQNFMIKLPLKLKIIQIMIKF